jgi:hypothetical protein
MRVRSAHANDRHSSRRATARQCVDGVRHLDRLR